MDDCGHPRVRRRCRLQAWLSAKPEALEKSPMAPSLRDWLPEDHFAWFVLDAVADMDLSAFLAAYRQDGHGRAAFDPAMMVALLLYAYAKGQRSSRVIERECVEDIAYRVIAANQRPDHTTVARFRQRHQDALAGLFGEVLVLCAEPGLVRVGVIAIDGTKVHANASERATCDYEQIAREILAEANAVDREEDERFGERRGDELPEQLATGAGRAQSLAEAKRRLERRRAEEARPIPASRPKPLRESKRRLEEELETECRANEAYEAWGLADRPALPTSRQGGGARLRWRPRSCRSWRRSGGLRRARRPLPSLRCKEAHSISLGSPPVRGLGHADERL